eukprot:maker-scaffold546_size140615-snap-gene-0.28 protein:Tk00842 transcript:maker-scaffold546_size140615-snap-gene-0.28-mRNA-1 annotation:"pbcv-specific basic adaptor domain-containing protein"
MAFFKALIIATTLALVAGDFGGKTHSHSSNRGGRQFGGGAANSGGVDFSGCQTDPETGFCCIEKFETVTSLQKDPILECTHKNVEKCHYTYVTQFEPAQEEVCEENFEKSCQVTFKQQAIEETVKKCYRPLEKVCNGQGPEECRTVYESSCTTKYIEKQPGKFVGDTSCEKLPIEICGAGCVTEEGPQECHDKTITSLLDVPEEACDLNPQKTCRFQTKLVPKLEPKHECTIIPQEICNLKFTSPQQVEKPLKTKWCQDPAAPIPDQTYDEFNAGAPPIQFPQTQTGSRPQGQPRPQPTSRPQFQPQPTRPQFQPQPTRPQFQPQTTSRPQFQPQPTRPQFQPQPTRPQFQPQPTSRPQFQPQPTSPPQFQPQLPEVG